MLESKKILARSHHHSASSSITQRSHEYPRPLAWNRGKIIDDPASEGVIDRYNYNGHGIFAFNAREIRDALAPKIAADPYYLVT